MWINTLNSEDREVNKKRIWLSMFNFNEDYVNWKTTLVVHLWPTLRVDFETVLITTGVHIRLSQTFSNKKYLTAKELSRFVLEFVQVCTEPSFQSFLWPDRKIYQFPNSNPTRKGVCTRSRVLKLEWWWWFVPTSFESLTERVYTLSFRFPRLLNYRQSLV